jgi:dTDP-glucose 4,6-dehydratase
MKRLLVTGGLGFLGAAFTRRAVERGVEVMVADLFTYAADESRLEGSDVTIEKIDVAEPEFVEFVKSSSPDAVVHFAAESHVTRGENDPAAFRSSNVEGTKNVVAAAERSSSWLVHISTDEVYGPCDGAPFKEDEKATGEGRATSAYARSKAVADDIAQEASLRFPLAIARLSNCYGPWQHPEKAIPRWIIRALAGARMPVWGDGLYTRDWMYVEDACRAIEKLIEGRATGVYNVAPEGGMLPNIEIARKIASIAGRDEEAVYLSAYDRPAHDRRYAIDASKMHRLNWEPHTTFDDGLTSTLVWYRDHREWWEPLVPSSEALYEDSKERADL